MNKILFCTTNANKIDRVKLLLLGHEIISLNDIKTTTTDPDETLDTCLTIAAQKALGYFDQLGGKYTVLTQDDTLQFLGVKPEDNPGTSIKGPVVKAFGEFNDENALKYYTSLVQKYGNPIEMNFEYGHAIASETQNGFSIEVSRSSLKARMVETIKKPEQVPGYFMSAMMEVLVGENWIHYMDLTKEQKVLADSDLKRSLDFLVKD